MNYPGEEPIAEREKARALFVATWRRKRRRRLVAHRHSPAPRFERRIPLLLFSLLKQQLPNLGFDRSSVSPNSRPSAPIRLASAAVVSPF